MLLGCPNVFQCSLLGASAPFSLFATKSLKKVGLIPVTVLGSLSLSLAWLGILMLGDSGVGSLPPPIPATPALGGEGLGQAAPSDTDCC